MSKVLYITATPKALETSYTLKMAVNCNKYLPFFSKKSACLLKIDLLTSTQVFS